MLRVAVGHSQDVLASLAAKDVIAQCQEQLGGVIPQAGILMAAIDLEHEVALEEIVRAFPGIQLVGSTTDGELSSQLGFQEDSLVFLALWSDTIEFGAGLGEAMSANVQEAAATAISQAKKSCTKPLRLCFITPASLTVSSSDVLASVQEELGMSFPIFGGIAGDQWRFAGTYQFFGTRKVEDALPLLLIAGPLHFSHGVASGWEPLGKKGRVTRAEGNVLYSINDRPAYSFFQYYLGRKVFPSGEYPLAVQDLDGPVYMRAPLVHSEADGTVTFSGDIPTGSIVQLSSANRQSILEASEESALQALESFPGEAPALAILVSCAARKLFLGTRTREEVDIIRSHAPDLPCFGFYAYGEFGSFSPGTTAFFHNETMITLLLGEAAL